MQTLACSMNNTRQLKVINALSKMMTLSLLSIMSTQIALVWDIWLYSQRASHGQNGDAFVDETWREYLFWNLLVFSSAVNTVCIVLSFDFADSAYHRLCACCDRICAAFIVHCSQRHYRQKKNRQNELEAALL